MGGPGRPRRRRGRRGGVVVVVVAAAAAAAAAGEGGAGAGRHAAARMAVGLGAEAGRRRERPRQTRGGTSRLRRRGREGARRGRREGAGRAPRRPERLRGCLQPCSGALPDVLPARIRASIATLSRLPSGRFAPTLVPGPWPLAWGARPPIAAPGFFAYLAVPSQPNSTHTKLKKKLTLQNALPAN